MTIYATALTAEALEKILESRTRVSAALKAIHNNAVTGSLPLKVPDIAPEFWKKITDNHPLPPFSILRKSVSADGTIKLLFEMGNDPVETVLIPKEKRSTVCVSSQSGCSRSCNFCSTARMGFIRNLDAGEIVLQVLLMNSLSSSMKLSPPGNVVYMGMGEPFDNIEEVIKSIDVLTANPLPGIAPGKITVSTSGILPGIKPFLQRSSAMPALSLHAVTDELRRKFIPHSKFWPIKDLINEFREALKNDGRILFVEYLIIEGINDNPSDAEKLANLLENIPCRVNLIPYNHVKGLPWREPASDIVDKIRNNLLSRGIRTMTRHPRGADANAACGQLAVENSELKHF